MLISDPVFLVSGVSVRARPDLVCVPGKMASKLPPPTQTNSKSTTVYKWVILFLYDEDTEFPFSCYPLISLENSDFPFHVSYNRVIKNEIC